MRYLYSLATVAFSLVVSCSTFGQGSAQNLSITNYQFVSQSPVTATQWQVVYKADVLNSGAIPYAAVTAQVTSQNPFSVRTINGKDILNFGPVPANGQVTSLNTFTILVDRTQPFSFTNLQWTFTTTPVAPIANAGANQTAPVGSTVTLNGSASTNPSGIGTLTYSWVFLSRPSGSSTALANRFSVMPSFVIDLAGTYTIQLTVSNGTDSSSATVMVSTANTPPVANAGPDQTVKVGSTVTLTGAGSTDVNGDPLTYKWTLTQRPAGSASILNNANTVSPTFVADKVGQYQASLTVNDGMVDSLTPSTVTITSTIVKPVADAGPNQSVLKGALVQLDGSKSTDMNGLPLTYSWSLITLPQGSSAVLSNQNIVNPTFTADLQGTYVAQLIVNNGMVDSLASTVTISTNVIMPPTAIAGANQMVVDGTLVTLHGTASDPQGLPLTLQWTMTMKPAGSTATLTNATSLTPTFVADLGGMYIIQLISNNGTLSSPPSTVTISTTVVQPVANAGPNQNVQPGATVTLNGSGSTDSNNQPLTYSWSLSVPTGSNATLTGAKTVSPTFVADVVGAYVAQLIVNDGFQNSNPATVMITAATMPVITLTPSPLTISSANGSQGTLTLTLSSAAGPSGLVVHLLSNDPSIVFVSPSVSIGAGGTSAAIGVSPGGNVGTTSVTASATGYVAGTATVNVVTPKLSLALDSSTIGLTKTINGTVTLNAPAGPTGVSVNLSSNPSGIVDVEPTPVKVPAGMTSTTFTVTGLALGNTTVTAGSPGYNAVSISVSVSNLGQILLPATATTMPGQTVALQLSLSAPAPAGGVTIALMSGDTSKVTVPASVFVAGGATAPTTLPLATGVNFGSAVITASAPGLLSATETVTVSAGLNFSPNTLTLGIGSTNNLTLNLSSPAPAGLVINLSSDNTSVATVPATVNFPTSATSVSVPVTGVGVGMATIHASSLPNLADTTASVKVVNLGSVSVPTTLNVGLGQSVSYPVSLSAAPSAPVTITLGTNNGNVTISPSMVSIAAGQTTPSVQPQATGVNFGSTTVTGSAPAYTSASGQVQVTASISFAQQSTMFPVGTIQNLTLNLSGNAPVAGVVINLSSSNSAVASVPNTVTISGGTSSVNVPVTGVTGGTATIHASSLPNLADTTTSVTVVTLGSIGLQSGVTVGTGQSTALAVTLSAPAPAQGVTVTLQSANTSILTVTPSVFIAGGQTTPTTQPQVTGVGFGSTTVTASGPGFNPGSQSVQVSGTLAFTPPMLSVSGTAPQNITLTLSSVAPAGGVTVNLSSENIGVATVPATATFTAGASTVQVPVSGVSSGSTKIHASLLPNLPDTSATITVMISKDILLPANVTVAPGSSVPYPVTLAQPAASNIIVTVTSANPNIASPSTANVLIPQGQTTSNFVLKVNGNAFGTTTMSATAFGLTGDTETVNVADVLTFIPSPIAIIGNTTQTVMLNLSAPAPGTGLTVNIKSDDPTVASVPATVSFLPNSQTATVAVTGVSTTGGSTTIHASSPPIVLDTTVPVTVAPPGMIVLPSNVTLAPSQTVPFPITLGTPAPVGGVSVMLTSSDPTKVTISPASVTVNGGQTQPAVQPTVTGVNLGDVTINAVASGYLSASQPVKVAATINFVPNSANIIGTATTNLQLTLSAPAPAGLVINLSASPGGVVTIPASVIFSTNATSVTVPVMGASAGQTTITASTSAANIASTTANITVAPAVPATISISGGGTQSAVVGMAFATPLSVTVKDSNNIVIANTAVTFAAVPGGNGQSGTFSNSTGTITVNTNSSGVASAGVFTANGKTGAYTVSVTAGPAPAATFNLTNTSGPATHYSITVPTQPVASGVNFNVTVTALDSFNNTATTYGGKAHFTSSDPNAGLPADATLAQGTVTVQASVKANQATITATEVGGSITITSSPITVNPGAPTHFAVTGAPSTVAAGTQFTLTVTAQDVNNQTVITYNGIVHLTSTDAKATLQGAQALTNGVGMFTVTLGTLGGQTVMAADPQPISGTTGTITVTPGPAKTLLVSAPGTANGGAAFNVTVTALDAYSNTATTYGGTVHFTSTDSAASLPANSTLTNGTGTFSATLNTAGTQTITGTDTVTNTITGVSGGIVVTTVATHFMVSAPPSATAGVPINFTVTALTAANTTATTYAGTVHFTSNDPFGATLPANTTLTNGVGTFPATLKKAQSNTTITATDTVTSSITGTSGSINVGIGTSAMLVVLAGSPQSAQLSTAYSQPLVAQITDLGGNPIAASGVFVTFTAPSSGATGTFAGSSQVTVVSDSNGQATATSLLANGTRGAFTVVASSGSLGTANFSLMNVNAVGLTNVSVGQNLQTTMTVTLPQVSSGASQITLTSSDPTKVLLYNGVTPPAASTNIQINAGDANGLVFIQGQAGGTGSVTVTAMLTGFDNGTGTVTVTNSGFVLSQQSGNGIGVSFTDPVGVPATLQVQAARLDASGNFVQIQPVATGQTVAVASSMTGVGTVTTPATFNAGDDTALVTFTSAATGSTTVTAVSPGSPYVNSPTIGCPSSCIPANSVLITVPPPGITVNNVSVGNQLAAQSQVLLVGVAPGGGLPITVSTSDARIQLSATLGGAGSSSINITAQSGQRSSPPFYVYGLASSGSPATFMANAGSFGSASATATFTASAIVIAGPSTVPGAGIVTTPGAGPQNVYLSSEQIDGSGLSLGFQPVAAAVNVGITQQINIGATGTIPSSVTIAAGTSQVLTTFTPTGVESGTLSVTEPAGFGNPQVGGSISVTVSTPGIAVAQNTIGNGLQVQGSFSLGQLAPSGGLMVTLTAQAGLLLSSSPTVAGMSSLTIPVAANGANGSFYIQAVGGSAGTTPKITASAPGYTFNAGNNNGVQTIVNSAAFVFGSGFCVAGGSCQNANVPVTVAHGTTGALTLYTAILDVNNHPYDHQALAGGTTLTVNINNTNPSAGTVTPGNPIMITGGTDGVALTFNAASGGAGQTTFISAVGGATPPVTVNVN